MKFLVLFLFCLVSVSVFVAADEEEDAVLAKLLEDEEAENSPGSDEEEEPRFAREVEEDALSEGQEPIANDLSEGDEQAEEEDEGKVRVAEAEFQY
ncbi:unnamed protein product [Porites lobata]|uniref:Uncharacterized protein n=1 Tax=Porites lobata TaxID=104759 RepID=A0ABN8QNS2_9CNID|nr:unnamed protein product [Porites lobata]|mmetsp:Transcript_57710/g.91355  ORF Transcript_57710/g.91355 Transcript_57710/m.91355 type:complete len:96 (-) Transcript_57710:179-466(-)